MYMQYYYNETPITIKINTNTSLSNSTKRDYIVNIARSSTIKQKILQFLEL